MKILIITVSPFPYDTASANLIRLLSAGLTINKCTVEILIQRGQTVKTYCNISKKRGEINGVFFKYCGYTKKPKALYKKFLDIIAGCIYPFYYIIKNRKKIDLVLTYNNYFYEDFLNILICKILRKKIVNYDVDWYNKESVVKSIFHMPKWYSYLIKKKYLSKYYSGIVVISNYLKEFYIEIEINQNKLHLMPNLVDFSASNIFTSNKSNRNTVNIGFIGGAPLLNGVDDLLSAFAILKRQTNRKIKLIIVGDTTEGESTIPSLIKLSNELMINNSVTFTGRIEGSEVPFYLDKIDIFVLPRKKGVFAEAGFPTKIGEYFSTSKPVILSRVGDLNFYFSNFKEVLFCDPEKPLSIANAALFLVENPKKAAEIGKQGYEWAKKNLEYKTSTALLKNFLIKI